MSITNANLATTVATTVFTAVGQQAITTIMLCNVSATSAATVNMFITPSGISWNSANQVLNSLSLPIASTHSMNTERFVLDAGDKIWVQSSVASAVSVTISSLATL